jgi:hypothetical protein
MIVRSRGCRWSEWAFPGCPGEQAPLIRLGIVDRRIAESLRVRDVTRSQHEPAELSDRDGMPVEKEGSHVHLEHGALFGHALVSHTCHAARYVDHSLGNVGR